MLDTLPPGYLLIGVELQKYFGISKRTVARWQIARIAFPTVIAGKTIRYPYSQVLKFFEFRTYTSRSKTKKWHKVVPDYSTTKMGGQYDH